MVPAVDYTDNGGGSYTFIDTSLADEVTISYKVSFPGVWTSALGRLGLNLSSGAIGQPVWSWLQSYSPAQALAYSGVAYVYADAYPLTNQAEVENHSFEVVTGHSVSPSIPDCWPDRILKDMLVYDTSSVGWREGRLAAMTQLIGYTRARQLWISVAMTQQRPAREWLEGLAMICNAEWTWQGGLLDLVPRGDEAITSSHGAYTPVTAPVFDLVHGEGGDILEPVEVTPRVNEDAHNIIKIEWTNRANGYTIEVMTASDAAHIEQFGERPKDVIQMHAIHDPAVAQSVAQQLLQREMTVWNTYVFKVPFTRALIGLMDLVTLTDADSDLLRIPVRILKREENGQLKYSFEAEDAPIGSASAPIYGTQAGSGFGHDYSAAPGSVAPPVIFEAPTERTSSGLEVYAAVSGLAGASGALWGGCSVHVSLDGLNYRNTGRLYGGARYGQLSAAMATSGNAAITLAGRGGQLLSGSSQDAAALSTLCWVAGTQGGEYFSYQAATLTAANAYTLSSLTRGAYQNPIAAHSSGAAFVRIDDSLATSGPLTDEMIGQTIYFKFTSFNVYGGGEQALADVAEYSYTVTGDQLSLPPPNVLAPSLSLSSEGVRANWSIFQGDYKDTWLRKGATWAGSVALGLGGEIQRAGTSYLVGWLPVGLNSIVFRHRDRREVLSQQESLAQITIAPPASVVLERIEVNANIASVRWGDSRTNQPILRYAYRLGTPAQTYAQATPWGSAGADSRSDLITSPSAGAFLLWFVAVDVAGNQSTPVSVPVTYSLPADFVLKDRFEASFSGSGVNATIDSGRVYMLWQSGSMIDHYSRYGWANANAKIAAGKLKFFEPGSLTSSYSEEYDMGAVTPTLTLKLAYQVEWLSGSGTITSDIAYNALPADPWTTLSDVTQVVVSGARYIKVTLRATGAGQDDLLRLVSMFTEASLQRIYEPFSLMLNAADVGGTPYVTTSGFTDLKAYTANPVGVGNAITRSPIPVPDDSGPVKQVFWLGYDQAGNRVSGLITGQISGV